MTDATLQRPRFQFPVEALRYGMMSQSYYAQVLNLTKQQIVDLDKDYKEMDISNGEKMGITFSFFFSLVNQKQEKQNKYKPNREKTEVQKCTE